MFSFMDRLIILSTVSFFQVCLVGFCSAFSTLPSRHSDLSGVPRGLSGCISGKFPEEVNPASGKRVLIFNWRDTKHAYGGGAEVYVEEIAKRWISDGHAVTMFCGNDGHQSRHEIRHGIRIVRRGGFYLVYVWAAIYYFARFRGKFDVVIDCENGVPFLRHSM